MACNAWNHHPDCNCDFAGGHGGHRVASQRVTPKISVDWLELFSNFATPNASCPVCEKPVYFIDTYLGGRVFFDDLGPPWPRHLCVHPDIYGRSLALRYGAWAREGWKICTDIYVKRLDFWLKRCEMKVGAITLQMNFPNFSNQGEILGARAQYKENPKKNFWNVSILSYCRWKEDDGSERGKWVEWRGKSVLSGSAELGKYFGKLELIDIGPDSPEKYKPLSVGRMKSSFIMERCEKCKKLLRSEDMRVHHHIFHSNN